MNKEKKRKKAKYDINYLKTNYKRVPLNLKIELYQKLKNYCDKKDIGIQTLIVQLITNLLDTDHIE